MSSIFQGKSWIYQDLCARLDINQLYEPAFRLHSRRINKYITLRPLAFGSDEEMIAACALQNWLPNSPSTSSPEDRVQAEKDVLEAVADSNAGQTFLGSIDDRAVFLTGIHKALQHPVSMNRDYKSKEGDYFLMLKIPPHPVVSLMDEPLFSLLDACLVYYFSYPAVESLLATIDRNDLTENEAYGRAGFRLLCETDDGKRLVYHHGKGYINGESGGAPIPVNEW